MPDGLWGTRSLSLARREGSDALLFDRGNHPFVDGNKRTGHAAMEIFLVLNGYELLVEIDEAERTILRLASGNIERDQFTRWVRDHVRPL